MKRLLTDEQIEWAYEQCQKGYKTAEVAEKFFVSRGTLVRYFGQYRRKTNAPKLQRGAPKILTDKQIRWAYNKWIEGYSLAKIADALLVSRSAIHQRIAVHRKPESEVRKPRQKGTISRA